MIIFKEIIGYNNNSIHPKLDEFLEKVSTKKYNLFARKLPNSIFNLLRENPIHFFYIFLIYFLIIPIKSLYFIYKVFNANNGYYRYIQDSIIDGMERNNGDIRIRSEFKSFIKKYFFAFFLRSLYTLYLLETISIFKKIKRVNTIFIEQFDGYPFGAISTYCLKNNIFICSCSMQIRAFENDSVNVNFLITKSIYENRRPLKEDLKKLSNIPDNELENYLEVIKKDFEEKKDGICNPNYLNYNNKEKLKTAKYYKSKIKNGKKNGIVLIHLLTDIARQRNEGIWINNYLEWLYETIDNCAKNKNINWFFKAHPFEISYPILMKHQNKIQSKIKENGFTYIEAKEKFLHKDVAELASIIITCHGTCKIEYPALYDIPVISCIGYNNITYDTENLPFTAKSSLEYSQLISNADKLFHTKEDLRKVKELLVFNKILSGKDIKEEIKIYKYKDQKGNDFIRSF